MSAVLLKNIYNTEVEFPAESYIGKGSFSKCHRCWLRSDPSRTLLAVKIFELESLDAFVKDWLLKHLVNEVITMHDIGQKNESFVRVSHLYNQASKLVGYTMPYYRHGSLRIFSARLSYLSSETRRYPWLMAQWMLQVSDAFDYLQSRQDGGLMHRDLAVDNVLIDDSLRAKIADFGLSKKLVHSVATQRTFDFENRRGIERRLPETYDDLFRQPDKFGDRYQYGIFVIEGFGHLSLRQVIGDRIEAFKQRVRVGTQQVEFQRVLDDGCFNRLSTAEAGPHLEQLRSITKRVVQKMTHQEPQQRATFAEVSGLWQLCDRDRMEAERLRVLDLLRDLPPDATIPSSGNRETVSLGLPPELEEVASSGPAMAPETAAAVAVEAEAEVAADSVEQQQHQQQQQQHQQHQQQQQQQPPAGLSISIGSVLGDVHTFRQPAGAAGGGTAEVRALQTVEQPLGDEAELLSRTYAEEVVDEALMLSLCRCREVAQKWWVILSQLGCTELDMARLQQRFGGSGASASDADRLMQELRRLKAERRLTVRELGEAFKRCGCLGGLRILRSWERDVGLPTM